ncbi:MAG TPA: phosphate/phosphite/phosphonate ABC transporter substrate-binding protein [Azonexus sp.]|nr:phosphate/phosphite/phosphonate ABC transporter substrate-binding protein [Azonexus sp.]
MSATIHRIALLCCFLLGCPLVGQAEEKMIDGRPLIVGLMPYLTTRTLLATYQPVAEALEKSVQQPITLQTAPDFDTFVKRVVDGEYDIALLAPHYARLATREYGYTPLLLHKAPIRGVLASSRSKPLNSFDDLRGQEISVVDRSALIAIAGALTLAENGLKENVDYRFVETVSHSSALHNAISGKARAALVSYSTLVLAAPDLQRDTQVWRDIANIPGQFYIAHSRIPAARQQAVKAALLAFEKSPEGQQFFEKTRHGGFRVPTPEDNALLDRMLPETRRQLGSLLH